MASIAAICPPPTYECRQPEGSVPLIYRTTEQRISISPEMAVRNREVTSAIDVTALLPQVSVPTLVLHARDDTLVRFEAGRRMAAGIPGARFVPLTGRNHLFLESEPAFGQFLEHTRAFLAT